MADNVLLAFKFISNVFKIYHINLYDFCVLIYIIIPQAANFTSVWIKILMTIERTTVVVYPFYKIFSRKTCKIVSFCIVFLFLALSSTAGFCSHHDTKKPYLCIVKEDIGNMYKFYFHSVYQIIKSTLESWLPSIIELVFNIIMIAYLRNRQKKRNSMVPKGSSRSANNYKDKQLTIMLLATSISFLTLTLPYSLFELDRKLFNFQTLNLIVHKKNLRQLQRASLFLVDLNHSTNFIFYFVCAEAFRNRLRNLFMCQSNRRTK